MKLSTITATLALLTTSALAAPTARQFEALITFHGATPDDTFTQAVPTDGTIFYICKSPSSHPFFVPSLDSFNLLLVPSLFRLRCLFPLTARSSPIPVLVAALREPAPE